MQVMLDDLMSRNSDQDGLIEHENIPDFTFDAWMFRGPWCAARLSSLLSICIILYSHCFRVFYSLLRCITCSILCTCIYLVQFIEK